MTQISATSSAATKPSTKWCWLPCGRRRGREQNRHPVTAPTHQFRWDRVQLWHDRNSILSLQHHSIQPLFVFLYLNIQPLFVFLYLNIQPLFVFLYLNIQPLFVFLYLNIQPVFVFLYLNIQPLFVFLYLNIQPLFQQTVAVRCSVTSHRRLVTSHTASHLTCC